MTSSRITVEGRPVPTPEEREWLRAEVDRRKRVKVAEAAAKNSSPAVQRKMTRDEVLAVHRSFLDGASIDEIAESVWERYGYATKNHCAKALERYFASLPLTQAA